MTRSSSLLILLAAQFTAACCGPDPLVKRGGGGNSNGGETSSGCSIAGETPLELDGTTPDGDSVLDMANTISGTHETSLTWADGSTADLDITISELTNARLIDYEVPSDGTGPAIEIDCVDVIAIDALVTVVSSDGELNESVDTTLTQAEFSNDPNLLVQLDESDGTFDATEWTTESFDAVTSDLTAGWDENGIHGTIVGFGETEYGEIVSVSLFDIGAFTTGGY